LTYYFIGRQVLICLWMYRDKRFLIILLWFYKSIPNFIILYFIVAAVVIRCCFQYNMLCFFSFTYCHCLGRNFLSGIFLRIITGTIYYTFTPIAKVRDTYSNILYTKYITDNLVYRRNTTKYITDILVYRRNTTKYSLSITNIF